MLPDKYFKTYGCIYGDRSRYIKPGKWKHEFFRFTNLNKAMEWKNTGDYGYTRELISKNEAKLRGMKVKEKT